MLLGHFETDNVIALVSGVLTLIVGVGVLAWRADLQRAAADIQRRTGGMGRLVAARPRPWAVLLAGVGFLAFGVLTICLGLFVELAPPA